MRFLPAPGARQEEQGEDKHQPLIRLGEDQRAAQRQDPEAPFAVGPQRHDLQDDDEHGVLLQAQARQERHVQHQPGGQAGEPQGQQQPAGQAADPDGRGDGGRQEAQGQDEQNGRQGIDVADLVEQVRPVDRGRHGVQDIRVAAVQPGCRPVIQRIEVQQLGGVGSGRAPEHRHQRADDRPGNEQGRETARQRHRSGNSGLCS